MIDWGKTYLLQNIIHERWTAVSVETLFGSCTWSPWNVIPYDLAIFLSTFNRIHLNNCLFLIVTGKRFRILD